jgi:NDP-sugar pyrophosphorylase family protein
VRAMILAAGLGTRMRPLTNYRAKPALPVRGRPVISLLLELLARHGVDQVLINLYHRPDTIRLAVESDHPEKMKIRWSLEPRPLGTGGGIRRAAEFLSGSQDCIVLAGDMLLDLDLGDLMKRHRASGRDATLILREDTRSEDFGTIGIDATGHLTRIGKRTLSFPSATTTTMGHASGPERQQGLFTGVRFFSRGALTGWPAGDASFEDLRDWLAPRIESGASTVGAEMVNEQSSVWEPVGTPVEYLEVNLSPPALPSLGGEASAWGGDILPLDTECGCIVASSAEIHEDARLERCVVWDQENVPAGFSGRDGVYAGNSFHPCRESASGSHS